MQAYSPAEVSKQFICIHTEHSSLVHWIHSHVTALVSLSMSSSYSPKKVAHSLDDISWPRSPGSLEGFVVDLLRLVDYITRFLQEVKVAFEYPTARHLSTYLREWITLYKVSGLSRCLLAGRPAQRIFLPFLVFAIATCGYKVVHACILYRASIYLRGFRSLRSLNHRA